MTFSATPKSAAMADVWESCKERVVKALETAMLDFIVKLVQYGLMPQIVKV